MAFLDEFQRCGFVSGLGHIEFQELALMVDGPPQVLLVAVDPDEHLIQVPARKGVSLRNNCPKSPIALVS